jgi:mono/diheme cytochrome c family protein
MSKGARAKGCASGIAAAFWIGSGLLGLANAQEAEMADLMSAGAKLFSENCAVCHGADGEGTGNAPALDGNGFVESRAGVINQVLWGNSDHGMPPFADVLSDEDIAAVSTYVRNAWSNDYGVVYARSVELRRPKE